jgi:hypothetical protein
VIDRSYHVDVEQCLANAQAIVRERTVFLEFAKSFTVVRSWTQTTALNDADETAGTILRHTHGGGVSVVGTASDWADLIDPMIPEILTLVMQAGKRFGIL